MISMPLSIGGAWPTNTITVDLWFYPTAYDIQVLSEMGGQSIDTGWHYTVLEVDSQGYSKARFYGGGSMTSKTKVILNQWNHAYITEDSQGGHTFELNGIGTGVQNPVYARTKPPGEFFAIGRADFTNMGSANAFQGKIGYLTIRDYVAPSTYSNTFFRFRPVPLQINLDAGNVNSYDSVNNPSYWFDTVQNAAFELHGGPAYSSDNGGYLSFLPASAQYADSTVALTDFPLWSVEVWHYYTDNNVGTNACILTEKFTHGYINYALGTLDGANLQAGYFNGWHTTTGHALTTGNWYHIVGTYDGANVKLYINGTLVEQTASTVASLNSGGGINLMRRWDNAEFWGGRLAQVRIYNGALSHSNVSDNFNAEKSRYGIS
jgi:hypothetical protein